MSEIPECSNPSGNEKIVLCICTCGRPQMLRRCVSSLANMMPVPAWSVEIIIIDNNLQPMPSKHVEALSEMASVPLHVFHESEPGIPFARNRALRESIARGADWIGFLDDDEEADPEWLREMHKASLKSPASILHGWTQSRPAGKNRSIFAPPPPRNKRRAGERMEMAGTDNVLFRASILGENRNELRFDENMRFLGGEDLDFFQRAVTLGNIIIWVPQAIARETIPASRLRLGYQVRRSMSVATAHAYISAKHHGLKKAVRKEGVKAIGKMASGLAGLVTSPLLLVKGRYSFGQAVLKSSKKIGYGAGVIGFFINVRPERYRQIDGN